MVPHTPSPGVSGEPTSFWRLTGPTLAGGARLPTRAQTVVAGAGLAGLATALELARAGHEVVVIDADQLGGRTTSRTTGKVSLLQGSTVSDLRAHAGDEAVQTYLTANAAGAAWMRAELASVPGAWDARPAYTYATTDEGADALAQEAEAMAAAGHPVVTHEKPPAHAIGLPMAVGGALRLDAQGQVHPVVAAGVLVDRIRELGGVFVDHCRITGAHAAKEGVTISTENGDLVADRLVLATGTPILDRALLFATLQPQRQAVVAFRLPSDAVVPAGMYLSVDSGSRSIRTAADRDGSPVLIVGGGGITTGRWDAVGDLRDGIVSWAAEHFPGATPITWWAAQDYRMTTRIPWAGAVRGGRDRIYALTGFAKWGMTNAPAAAIAIAGELAGDAPEWHRTLRAEHAGARDIGETIKTNAEVGAHLIEGWVVPKSHWPSGRARIVREGLRPVAESRLGGVECRVSAVCTHLGGIVRWNDAESSWDCPLHGSRFTPDGRVIEGPATTALATIDDGQEAPERAPRG